MKLLIATTLIWSFSFSIIGNVISSAVDSWSLAFYRSFLGFIFFLPWIKKSKISKYQFKLIPIGALQIGLMYIFYLSAFNFTTVPRVLLFTTTTPLFIAITDSFVTKKLRTSIYLLAFFSTIGALIIRTTYFDHDDLMGFLLIQCANICFAFGQILYKTLKMKNNDNTNIYSDFAFFFFGALLVSCGGLLISPYSLSLSLGIIDVIAILWLGIFATGLGYFMWNRGTVGVSSSTLAVTNNLVIPLGLFVEILFFNSNSRLELLMIGACIIIASIVSSLKIDTTKA